MLTTRSRLLILHT